MAGAAMTIYLLVRRSTQTIVKASDDKTSAAIWNFIIVGIQDDLYVEKIRVRWTFWFARRQVLAAEVARVSGYRWED